MGSFEDFFAPEKKNSEPTLEKKRYTYSDTNIPEEGSIDSKFPSCNVWGLD